MSDSEKPVRSQELIETYHAISEWIRFADAKAAVVLTVGGALASVLIPTLKPYIIGFELTPHLGDWWLWVVIALFVLWLIFLVISSVHAFLCILPLRRGGKHPALDDCKHFHPAAISAAYKIDQVGEFRNEYKKLGENGFGKEVLAGVLIDAHISSAKYRRVTSSIKMLAISAVYGFLYLLASQF